MIADIVNILVLIFLNQNVVCTKTLENLSINKPAYQSGDWLHAGVYLVAGFAIDGNSDTFALTVRVNNPWWMVDLGDVFVVKQIFLFDDSPAQYSIDVFRTDPRIKVNFNNEPGEVCNKMTPTNGLSESTWNCTTPVIGRYVRYIIHNYYGSVSIMELRVMGYLFDPNDGHFSTNKNTFLQLAPIFNTQKRSLIQCAGECLKPRQDQICMGFNWISSTKKCQLMDFSTRNTSLSSLMVYNTDATFAALEQAWNK